MNNTSTTIIKNEQGMALVVCLMIMVVMALIATGVTTNSTVEIKISGNQRNKAVSFNNADVGTGITPEIIEQNLNNVSWDSSDPGWVDAEDAYLFLSADNNNDGVNDMRILVHEYPAGSGKIAFSTISGLLNNAVTIESKIDALGHILSAWRIITSIDITISNGLAPGNSIQMAAGYEGLGKGVGPGCHHYYLCKSTGYGGNHTRTITELYYRHIP